MPRLRNGVVEKSRKAVAVAGTRPRRGLSGSAHKWTEKVGKREDGPWRPGKTKSKHTRHRP